METKSNRIYRRKNDRHYITLLLYVLFGILYVAITSTITDDTIIVGFKDPVVYIIVAFVLYALVRLFMNLIRSPRIVFNDENVVFRTRFGERKISIATISTILVLRERDTISDGIAATVKMRVAKRRRWYRIKVSNFEREKSLYDEFMHLKAKL